MFVDWPNVLNIVPSSKAVLRVAEAIFFSSSLLAVICSRWESQLAEKMKEAEEGLEQRYVFYVSHLQLAGANRVGGKQGSAGEAWSCSRWLRSIRFCGRSCAMAAIGCHWLPTRPRRDLIDHLNGLRAFWSMGRPGELQEAKEASRTWRVFMQNLCLLLASKASKRPCFKAVWCRARASHTGALEVCGGCRGGPSWRGSCGSWQRDQVVGLPGFQARGSTAFCCRGVWEETEQGDWLLTEGIDEATSALLERCVLEQMRRKSLKELLRSLRSREVFSLKRISAEELQRVEAF